MPLPAVFTRRSMARGLILSLACVLVCAFSIKRAFERTPINQETGGFKFSKTLELPHKKTSVTSITVIRTEPMSLTADVAECSLPCHAVPRYDDTSDGPKSSRAPPPAATL